MIERVLYKIAFSEEWGRHANHHYKMQEMLGGIPLIQVCREEGICKMERKNSYRISASRFFA